MNQKKKGGVILRGDREYKRVHGQFLRVKKPAPQPKQFVVSFRGYLTMLHDERLVIDPGETYTVFETASAAKKAIHKSVEFGDGHYRDYEVQLV